MTKNRKRRIYDKTFKEEAVKLVVEDGLKAAEVERNLGEGVATHAKVRPLTTTALTVCHTGIYYVILYSVTFG